MHDTIYETIIIIIKLTVELSNIAVDSPSTAIIIRIGSHSLSLG